MASRYDTTDIGINSSKKYAKIFKERNVPYIEQYFTLEMRELNVNEISSLQLISHLWVMGDRYYKLANKYYGDPTLWWVIARFNQKPTESHLVAGDVVQIPLPVERVLDYWGL
tara:strand:+ start:942 stop:1280 length:339 start_codon:yes stop_codon:yes gene_type:complete